MNSDMKPVIKIFESPRALAEALTLDLINRIREAGNKKSLFTIAVSGGKTPELFFSVLAGHLYKPADWGNVHFFWVDERCVPPDDYESNFGMTQRAFLSKVQIPATNIHRIRGEYEPEEESVRYEDELNRFTLKHNGLPRFNIMFLGLGEDGHTASIFPGNEQLFRSSRLCVTAIHPVTGQIRITLTGKVINNSGNIIFLATGKTKAPVIKKIIDPENAEEQFPASHVVPVDGKLFWYIDKEAGSLLNPDIVNE